MSKFILKIILLFLPLAVLIGFMEFKAGSLQSDYGRKRLIVEKQIESAKIIVLGASHTYYGINTSMFDAPSLNLSYISQDLYYDHQLLFKYMPRAISLRVVIISVSYPSLEGEMQNSIESWRTSAYRRYWDIPAKSPFPKLGDYSSIALFGIQATRDYWMYDKPLNTGTLDDQGNPIDFRAVNLKLQREFDKTVQRHQESMRAESVSENLQYLTEMVQALQSRDVKVALVTTPCLPNYYNNISQQKYNSMQEILKDLSQKYNVEYHNYLKDPRFNESDFNDIDHLNTQGAEKFTTILKQDINALSNLK